MNKKYILPGVGFAIIIVAIISWLAIPAWRNQPGGFLYLLGVVALVVLAAAKDGVALLKEAGLLKSGEDEKKSGSAAEAPKEQASASGDRAVAITGGAKKARINTGDTHHVHPEKPAPDKPKGKKKKKGKK